MGRTSVIESTISVISIENFLKLTKSTGDYYAVISAIEKLEKFLKKMIEKDEDPYLNAALTNLYLLRSLVNSACVFPCYVLVRNIIENIAKSIVYAGLSKDSDAEYLLGIIFFYEQQYGQRKIYSPKDLSRKSIKYIQEIHNELYEEEFYYERIIESLRKKEFSRLRN